MKWRNEQMVDTKWEGSRQLPQTYFDFFPFFLKIVMCVRVCMWGRPSMPWPTCRNLRLTPNVGPHLLPCLGDRIRCLVLLMAALPGSWTSREPPAFAPTSQEELWYYDSTGLQLAACESWSHKCFTHQDVSSALPPLFIGYQSYGF